MNSLLVRFATILAGAAFVACSLDLDRQMPVADSAAPDVGRPSDGPVDRQPPPVDARDLGADTSDSVVNGNDSGVDANDTVVHISFKGDCEVATCPPDFPNVIGCEVVFDSKSVVCFAHRVDDSKVYFQEGEDCCFGSVSGTIACSSVAGSPFDAKSCTVKTSDGDPANVIFVAGCGGCADTHCDGVPRSCKYP